MASAARQYQAPVYGNTAYFTQEYQQGSAAPRRRRDRGPQLQELPLVRPRKGAQQQVHTRVKVNLRPQDEVSFLPAVGLLAAAFMAVMIVLSYSRLDGVYAQTVQARHELTALQQEERTLTAQYEEVFDQAALDAAIAQSDVMLIEAQNDQKIYVDLSEPDNAVVYDRQNGGLWDTIQDLLGLSGS